MSGTFTFRSSETHMRFIHFCVINELKTSNLSFSLKKIIDLYVLIVSSHKKEQIAGAFQSTET
jgi:hypothetical protein